MSRLAPFVDAAASIDRTNWANTFISYYTWGAAIGLGLDLSLRDRSNGRMTLDNYMRALWARHGRPGQKRAGHGRDAVHDGRSEDDARRGERRSRVRARRFSPATSRGTTWWITRTLLARGRPVRCASGAPAPRSSRAARI